MSTVMNAMRDLPTQVLDATTEQVIAIGWSALQNQHSSLRLQHVGDTAPLLALLANIRPKLLLLGPELPESTMMALRKALNTIEQTVPLLISNEHVGQFADYPALFYCSKQPPPLATLLELITCAITPTQPSAMTPQWPTGWPDTIHHALARLQRPSDWLPLCNRLLSAQAAVQLNETWLLSHSGQQLIRVSDNHQYPVTGLAGLVTRQKHSSVIDNTAHPLFEVALDCAPKQDGCLCYQPVLGPAGDCVAVHAYSLSPAQLQEVGYTEILMAFATASYLHVLRLRDLWPRTPSGNAVSFRAEALAHQQTGQQLEGGPLRASHRWLAHSYSILTICFLLLLLIAAGLPIKEYASGPAVIRLLSDGIITSPRDGIVRQSHVQPGQTVRAGELLADLYSSEEATNWQRLQRQFDVLLRQRLRDPSDRKIAEQLMALRGERDAARAQLAHAEIRASRDGLLDTSRLVPGLTVSTGQVVAQLRSATRDQKVQVLLPAQYRPLLQTGQPLRVELQGFPYQYLPLRIAAVDPAGMGPAQARQNFGVGLADAVAVNGSQVLVVAELPEAFITVDGQQFPLHDGMLGRADVTVRSTPLLLLAIPGLRTLDGTP